MTLTTKVVIAGAIMGGLFTSGYMLGLDDAKPKYFAAGKEIGISEGASEVHTRLLTAHKVVGIAKPFILFVGNTSFDIVYLSVSKNGKTVNLLLSEKSVETTK